MRVGIISLQHESNTFISTPTTLDNFRKDVMAVGEEIREKYADSFHEVAGFLARLKQESDIEAVPLVYAWTVPSGTISADAADYLINLAMQQLDAAGDLDGLLVAPHGAGVSEKYRDFDGQWLTLVREKVGPNLPIICTLDPHANVSQRMIDACNATICYHTNPHEDQLAVGKEAADLMVRTLRGEVKPTQVMVKPGIAISIDKQETGAFPCRPMYELGEQIKQRPSVEAVSVILSFPYADVEEFGSGFIVVTNNDAALANAAANELADYLYEHRQDYACDLPKVEEAVRQADAFDGRVCLLDVGDNVGGGSAADGTTIAHELDRQGVADSIVAIFDPEAADAAWKAGIGATLTLTMGGKTDDLHGEPFTSEVTVEKLHEGYFKEPEPRHGGRTEYHMGPTAAVKTPRGLTIILNSKRTAPFSLHQIKSTGLDPRDFHVLAAKGVNAPIAAYREVCDKFIRVDTPGTTGANMTHFEYKHRSKPLFPFEEAPARG